MIEFYLPFFFFLSSFMINPLFPSISISVCECIECVLISIAKQSNVCSSDGIAGCLCCETFGCFKYRKCSVGSKWTLLCVSFFRSFALYLCPIDYIMETWRSYIMEIRSVRWSAYKAFVVAFNFRIEYGFYIIPALSIHVAPLSLFHSCTHTVALSNSNFPFFLYFFIVTFVPCIPHSSLHLIVLWIVTSIQKIPTTTTLRKKKTRKQQQSQSFFNVQKNCDPNDTSTSQPDDLEPNMNMNCDYEVAINVSIISLLYVKRKKKSDK